MEVEISKSLKESLPDLNVLVFGIRGVRVERENPELEEFKKNLVEKIRERYDLETLKDQPILRAYRSFYWRVGIDPTKTRPAAEALIRRVLSGKPIPRNSSPLPEKLIDNPPAIFSSSKAAMEIFVSIEARL
jgi:DNA/RNA-binding domain of Phe-tRNA-synthetase-like protein